MSDACIVCLWRSATYANHAQHTAALYLYLIMGWAAMLPFCREELGWEFPPPSAPTCLPVVGWEGTQASLGPATIYCCLPAQQEFCWLCVLPGSACLPAMPSSARQGTFLCLNSWAFRL